jgi:hypothetical protein
MKGNADDTGGCLCEYDKKLTEFLWSRLGTIVLVVFLGLGYLTFQNYSHIADDKIEMAEVCKRLCDLETRVGLAHPKDSLQKCH